MSIYNLIVVLCSMDTTDSIPLTSDMTLATETTELHSDMTETTHHRDSR